MDKSADSSSESSIRKTGHSWSASIADLLGNPAPFTDVTFLVGKSKEIIEGHKLILGIRSPVFKEKFFRPGPVASSRGSVIVDDVTPKAFRQLLEVIYKGEAPVNMEDLPALAVAAKKYALNDILDDCKKTVLDAGIFSWYQRSIEKNRQRMAEDLWSFILRMGNDVLESEDLLNMSHGNLCKLLTSEDLNCSELIIAKAALRWAKNRCQKENRIVTPASLRFVLKDALTAIRFPILSIQDFESLVKGEGINLLFPHEVEAIYQYHVVQTPPRLFSCQKRGVDSQDSNTKVLCNLVPRITLKKDSVLETDSEDLLRSIVEDMCTASSSCIINAVKQESPREEANSCPDAKDSEEPEDVDSLPFITLSQNIFKQDSSSDGGESNENCSVHRSPPPYSKVKATTISPSNKSNAETTANEMVVTKTEVEKNSEEELIAYTPKPHIKEEIQRKRPIVQTEWAPNVKKPRKVEPGVLSKTKTLFKKIKTSNNSSLKTSKTKAKPPKIRSRKMDKENLNNARTATETELKYLPASCELTGQDGLLSYSNLISTCSGYPKLEKIALFNVNIEECRGKRQEQFGKVLLNDLKAFRLEISTGRLKAEELVAVFKKLKIEEYLFFMHLQNVNEQFIKALQKYDIKLSVNGATILNVSVEEKSITTAFSENVHDVVGNCRGSLKTLAFGYCDFSSKINAFPFERLIELVVSHCRIPKDSGYMDFLFRCSKLESLKWYEFYGRGLDLDRDLACHQKLKILAISNAKLKMSRVLPQFPKVDTVTISGGNWDAIEGRLNYIFPKVKFVCFGGPYSPPSCRLLKELLGLPLVSTIEIWYFDIDATDESTSSTWATQDTVDENALKKEMKDLLYTSNIDSSTTNHFVLTKSKNRGKWMGKKNQEIQFEKRMYDLFDKSRFFDDFTSNQFDDSF